MFTQFLFKKIKLLSPNKLFQPKEEMVVVSTKSPTPKDYALFEKHLITDSDYCAFEEEERKDFLQFVYELERKIPVLNTNGVAASSKIRLTIFFYLAKLNFYRGRNFPKQLHVVILEADSFFLTKHDDASGLAAINGPKRYLPFLRDFLQLLNTYYFPTILHPEVQKILSSLEKNLKAIQKISEKQVISDFNHKQAETLLLEWNASLKQIFQLLHNDTRGQALKDKEKTLEKLENLEQSVFQTSDNLKSSLNEISGMNIHISWPYFISQSFHKKGQNVIIHELAHLIDFENGGLNGIPASGLSQPQEQKQWAAKWKAEFEGARAGKMPFLENYAQVSPVEFFAVASAFYFYNCRLIEVGAPKLFSLLKTTYGYVPKANLNYPNKKINTLNMLRMLSHSRKEILNL